MSVHELLAAIYAEPDNRDVKAVYGDWLAGRGDPQGELIGLALAGTTPASERRILALVAEHGERWAGALGAHFAQIGRRFVDGFFAGGVLEGVPPSAFDDPAWRLVRHLGAGWSSGDLVLTLVGHPALAGVRSAQFARTGADLVELARTSPAIDHLEALEIVADRYAREVAAALVGRGPRLRELVLVSDARGRTQVGWRVRVIRDPGSGLFTRVIARHHGSAPNAWRWASSLETMLARIAPTPIREIRIEGTRKVLRHEDRATLNAALARFPNATTLEVPWRDSEI